MNIRSKILVVLLVGSSTIKPALSPAQAVSFGDYISDNSIAGQVFRHAMNSEFRPLVYTGFGLGCLWVISTLQKQNPDFFNSLIRFAEAPLMVLQKTIQEFSSGGRSLTWNELASWHNRVAKLFTPLTKATTVLDLSKERRLATIDTESGESEQKDEQWLATVTHITMECAFLCNVLEKRLRYYDNAFQEIPDEEDALTTIAKAPLRCAKDLIKYLSKKTSLTRDEEIAFGLAQAMLYVQELSAYCSSVQLSSSLDKETIKRLMNSTCATLEHLGVLVDEVGAADKNKKKLSMTLDATTPKGFTAGGFGGYDGAFAGI